MNITIDGKPVEVLTMEIHQDVQPVSYFEMLREPFFCVNGHKHEFEGDKITNTRQETGFDEDTQEEYTYRVCAECGASLHPHKEMRHAHVCGHAHRTLKVHSPEPLAELATFAGFEGHLERFNGRYALSARMIDVFTFVNAGTP